MPEPGIVLNSDQIGDLHELLDHAETIAQWLLHATDEIIDDLAQAAYAAHFHPRSAVFWLVEDLVHTQYRLNRALHPDTGSHDQDPGQDTHAEPTAQAATSTTTSHRGRLDTTASIGNQSGRGCSRSSSSQARSPLNGSRALIICHWLVIEFGRHLAPVGGTKGQRSACCRIGSAQWCEHR